MISNNISQRLLRIIFTNRTAPLITFLTMKGISDESKRKSFKL